MCRQKTCIQNSREVKSQGRIWSLEFNTQPSTDVCEGMVLGSPDTQVHKCSSHHYNMVRCSSTWPQLLLPHTTNHLYSASCPKALISSFLGSADISTLNLTSKQRGSHQLITEEAGVRQVRRYEKEGTGFWPSKDDLQETKPLGTGLIFRTSRSWEMLVFIALPWIMPGK